MKTTCTEKQQQGMASVPSWIYNKKIKLKKEKEI
jgi:hypothetical protein